MSMTGRLIYAKSVLSALTLYTMQTILLPKHVCTRLDAITRDFIWGSNDSSRAWHLINWKTIAQPKENGGLGIQCSRERNLALLTKLGWRYSMILIVYGLKFPVVSTYRNSLFANQHS